MENNKICGWWNPTDIPIIKRIDKIDSALIQVTKSVAIINYENKLSIGLNGISLIGDSNPIKQKESYPLYAYTPSLSPDSLGDPVFKKRHNIKYAYVAGAMANGITSIEMVEAMSKAGMIGFFGSAGLPIKKVEQSINILKERLETSPFGVNLIHTPGNPELELSLVNLYMEKGISLISAAAYMKLTLPIVYFRVKGIYQDDKGNIVTPNKIIAKVSRIEIAKNFFSPPPEKILKQLVQKNMLTQEEASLAANIPMADDITAEADSGGHTDNRPAIALLPTIMAVRDELAKKYNYKTKLCVGLGGGIATPESISAAFSMGAAYVLTGSVNQACVESGTSDIVRQMLVQASQADVIMAPSADMFEMGVKVQVLKRGTMFALRAAKLYELYRKYDSFEEIPDEQKSILETKFFQAPFDEVWEKTKEFFIQRDPKQIQRAQTNQKHKMSLVFRSYLGRSSGWAISGDTSRKMDYQIWCGPSIGAFNEWVKKSFLSKAENRKVVIVAMNLLMGACFVIRKQNLQYQNTTLPIDTGTFKPMELDSILANLK